MKFEFEKGDIVRLKSGSPDMTIENINDQTKTIETVWFDNVPSMNGSIKKNVFRDSFDIKMLKPVIKKDDRNDR